MTEPANADRPEWGDVQLDALIDRANARINTPRIGKMAYRETDADILVIRDLITALTTTRTALAEATEHIDREPSERLMVAPAIQAVRDVLNGLEDWEIQDRALEEIRSAVDDIPDCESATAIPHEEHGEPSDAEVEAAARKIYETDAEWSEPGTWFTESEPLRSDYRATARTALLAAQEVRRG